MSAPAVAELFGLLGIKTDFESVAKAQSALNKLRESAAAATQTAELSAALKHVHGDAKKAADLISLNYDKAAAGAAKSTSWAEKWGKALVVINQGLEVAGKLYGAVRSGIEGIVSAVQASAAQANQALDLSQRLGIAIEDVQRLGYAAGQSSTNLDELAGGLGKLANTLDNAKKGSKDAAAALHAVGLSKADAGKPLDENLNAIADAFTKIPDGARKAALASDLFGQAGVRLIPFLNKGRAGIGALKDEADKLGVVIDGKTAGALQGFGDATDRLHQTISGVRNQVVAALLPAIVELVNGAQRWIAANRQLVSEAAIGAARILLGVVQGLVVALKIAAEVLAFFGRHATLTKTLLIALAGIVTVVAAAVTIAFASMAAPAMVMAAIIVGLIKLWPLLARAARATGRAIADAFHAVVDAVRSIGASISDFFAGIGSAIKGAFIAVVDWIIGKINWVTDKVNYLIRGMNKLPGVDIDQIGKIDKVGGKGKASVPGTASIPAPSGKGGDAFLAPSVTVNVHAKTGADPQEIGREAARAAKGALDEHLRGARAALGGKK